MRRWRFSGIVLVMLMVMTRAAAAPLAQLDPFLEQFVFDTRADLELLADGLLGETRPAAWTGNSDTNSRTIVSDLWFDNEQLADLIFGIGSRPPDWFGASGSTAQIIARNVRHDLEVLGDDFYGERNRPPEWRGAEPIYRCSRTLQNVVDLLVRFYGAEITTVPSALDYCASVESEVQDDLIDATFSAEQASQIPQLLLAVRGDLERLADETQGLNNRPPTYIRNTDPNSPTLAGDLYLDLETLADTLLGLDVRPPRWIGVITANDVVNYRTLRHDLELLADAALGVGSRPNGWQGTDPALRCEPLVQSLVILVTSQFNFSAAVPVSTTDFCTDLSEQANRTAENPPVEDIAAAAEEAESRFNAESNYAFTYLDVAATQYMGIMPAGIEFRAWYRNFEDSNMMFVSGDNFALFVDARFTTLEPQIFDALPTVEGQSILTFCDAAWCNGPGPTPTPTGFGPLGAVLAAATPLQATAVDAVGDGAVSGNKTQVSWNNIRVTYITDNAETRTAQVALEICVTAAANATACEPVTSVYDVAANAEKPAVTQANGLNVYEFRYGYTQNVLIEGETLFSNDIWISDPTIR